MVLESQGWLWARRSHPRVRLISTRSHPASPSNISELDFEVDLPVKFGVLKCPKSLLMDVFINILTDEGMGAEDGERVRQVNTTPIALLAWGKDLNSAHGLTTG